MKLENNRNETNIVKVKLENNRNETNKSESETSEMKPTVKVKLVNNRNETNNESETSEQQKCLTLQQVYKIMGISLPRITPNIHTLPHNHSSHCTIYVQHV